MSARAELSKEDRLLIAWVRLSGLIKNNRITKGLAYNEAAVMLLVYSRYLADGEGSVAIRDIVNETGMLKSQVNRTVNALEAKGMLVRCPGKSDRRTVFVKCVEEGLETFLAVHRSNLAVAHGIADIIGEEDTEHIIRIVNKIADSDYRPSDR